MTDRTDEIVYGVDLLADLRRDAEDRKRHLAGGWEYGVHGPPRPGLSERALIEIERLTAENERLNEAWRSHPIVRDEVDERWCSICRKTHPVEP